MLIYIDRLATLLPGVYALQVKYFVVHKNFLHPIELKVQSHQSLTISLNQPE